MFVPTKSDVKLANENMGHAQVIGIILCHFTNFPIIYPVAPVYYCPGHPSNTILPGELKFYPGCIMGQLVKLYKTIPFTWACPIFALANFTSDLVWTNIEKCYMQFVTATFLPHIY